MRRSVPCRTPCASFDSALLERTLTERDQQRLAQLLRKLLVSLEPQRSAAAAGRGESLLRLEA